jgi:ribosome-binding ATPase YchF (GTP1/OBG family)
MIQTTLHVEGSIDPLRDIETVQIELSLADLEQLKNGYSP